jgi:hypothetical protein
LLPHFAHDEQGQFQNIVGYEIDNYFSACRLPQRCRNGYGQKVSLSTKDGSLEQIFTEIKKQTGYTFVYTDCAIAKSKAC